MGSEVKRILVCDRCGTKTEVNPTYYLKSDSSVALVRARGDGWEYAKGRVLCPACNEEWKELLAHQDLEQEAFFGK